MLELTGSGEFWENEYQDDKPLITPVNTRDCWISNLGVAPSNRSIYWIYKGPTGLSSNQHLLSSAVLQHFTQVHPPPWNTKYYCTSIPNQPDI